MSNLIVVAKYLYPLDANIAKVSLECAGITAFIGDEHTPSLQWSYSDVVGGVCVFVEKEHEDEAKSILKDDLSLILDVECKSKVA
ncbi:putative signal transducing protein [Pseudoalteromonas denitrificans]|uniref:Putative signal transducing protein n=1 Tax=Pseudoalteromonas denitrificans DSM 6059 TaxID=1123010 RepID=A0A1I1MR32_9GAMM|nr:DUF2007 domain-containing protein [Pseudoalteromonas denitrificans]SFC87566.1 Putative signal transducing protein [Pseudoalteromonas denitrificans DSM 6059]